MSAQDVTVGRFVGWLKGNPAAPKCIVITPEIALEALTHNTDEVAEDGTKKQRPLSTAWVRELARRMDKGMWRLTSEMLAFDWHGYVQNGQHRLHAVVESGINMPAWVKFGEDPELFSVIDGGRKRSAGDIFAARGEPNANQAAAITRVVNQYREGYKTITTPDEVFDYYCDVGTEDVQEGVRMYWQLTSHHIPHQAVVAGLYVLAHQMTNGDATEFFTNLATGANLGPRSIEKKLRDHLLVHGRAQRREKVGADVVRAWNAKRTKRRTFSTAPVDSMPKLV